MKIEFGHFTQPRTNASYGCGKANVAESGLLYNDVLFHLPQNKGLFPQKRQNKQFSMTVFYPSSAVFPCHWKKKEIKQRQARKISPATLAACTNSKNRWLLEHAASTKCWVALNMMVSSFLRLEFNLMVRQMNIVLNSFANPRTYYKSLPI